MESALDGEFWQQYSRKMNYFFTRKLGKGSMNRVLGQDRNFGDSFRSEKILFRNVGPDQFRDSTWVFMFLSVCGALNKFDVIKSNVCTIMCGQTRSYVQRCVFIFNIFFQWNVFCYWYYYWPIRARDTRTDNIYFQLTGKKVRLSLIKTRCGSKYIGPNGYNWFYSNDICLWGASVTLGRLAIDSKWRHNQSYI